MLGKKRETWTTTACGRDRRSEVDSFVYMGIGPLFSEMGHIRIFL